MRQQVQSLDGASKSFAFLGKLSRASKEDTEAPTSVLVLVSAAVRCVSHTRLQIVTFCCATLSRSYMPTAFIVHGQDTQVRRELEKFLEALSFEILPFHAARSGEAQIDVVLQNVVNGVTLADIVIVLFTPEEQASFHDPERGHYVAVDRTGEAMGGWQPRPNVLFETGVAVVSAKEKTILVKKGSVRSISDLAGILFVNLDADDAKKVLLRALQDRVKGLTPPRSVGELPGDFIQIERTRWPYHDELGKLERALSAEKAPGSKKTLFEALAAFVEEEPDPDKWTSPRLITFLWKKVCKDTKDNGSMNATFWQFMIHGVLAFNDIDVKGNGWSAPEKKLWWDDLQEHVSLTARGSALLRKLLVQSDVR